MTLPAVYSILSHDLRQKETKLKPPCRDPKEPPW
jgi:hypothetical protein